MLVAVLVRGTRNLNYKVKQTLKQLKLTRHWHAVLLQDTPTSRGMLGAAERAVAWGEASEDVAKKIESKGSSPARLRPPRERFGTIKLHYPKGMLGYWGKDISSLVESMV